VTVALRGRTRSTGNEHSVLIVVASSHVEGTDLHDSTNSVGKFHLSLIFSGRKVGGGGGFYPGFLTI
jgi:hypothetical protein